MAPSSFLPLCSEQNLVGLFTLTRSLPIMCCYACASTLHVLHIAFPMCGFLVGNEHAFRAQVAMARLFIRGRDYGPHAFVVPIRDMATHLPLPGIKVGDIGPKFGYNGVDNGFLSFNHVRVPRDNMLMRFAKACALPSIPMALGHHHTVSRGLLVCTGMHSAGLQQSE